jgi:hypothetical protein
MRATPLGQKNSFSFSPWFWNNLHSFFVTNIGTNEKLFPTKPLSKAKGV